MSAWTAPRRWPLERPGRWCPAPSQAFRLAVRPVRDASGCLGRSETRSVRPSENISRAPPQPTRASRSEDDLVYVTRCCRHHPRGHHVLQRTEPVFFSGSPVFASRQIDELVGHKSRPQG